MLWRFRKKSCLPKYDVLSVFVEGIVDLGDFCVIAIVADREVESFAA